MDKLFDAIGKLIEKRPVKTLLLTIILFAILIVGVSNMQLATGNETMVQVDNEVYLSNKQMEDTFGGDAIIVLFKDEIGGKLLSYENIRKMWHVEQKLKYEDHIFSITSPASLVHQMTEQQSIEIKKQLLMISSGLEEMSLKIINIGKELGNAEIPDMGDLEEKLSQLSQSSEAFASLIMGQDALTEGLIQFQNGLVVVADGLGEASSQLLNLSSSVTNNPELTKKLNTIAENINTSSLGIRMMGEQSSDFQEGTSNTSKALTSIHNNLPTMGVLSSDSTVSEFSISQLKEMAIGFEAMGKKLSEISQGLDTFHSKSSMMIADIPGNQEELDLIFYDENNERRSIFSDVILDDDHGLMVIKFKGNLDDGIKDQITNDIKDAIENEDFETILTIVSGKPVLDSSLRTEMKTNMMMMVGLAVLIMLIVLAIVFKVRWKMLSLGIVLISVIATLGFMGILSVPITMVSMAVFPILIGLGIDYSIQFHNRFEEEKSVKTTMNQMGKAIAIAVFATVLGFISLYASPVPMIQDFGKMLTIGVIISFIASMLLLLPILYLREKFDAFDGQSGLLTGDNSQRREHRKSKTQTKDGLTKETLLDKILKVTTKSVVKYSMPILLVFIGLAIGGFYADGHVGVETDIETFMPQEMEALKDIHIIRDAVGSTDQLIIYLKSSNVLTEENISWMRQKTTELETKYADVVVSAKSIDTLVKNMSTKEDITFEEYTDLVTHLPSSQKDMFVNEAGTEAVILLSIKHLPTDELKEFTTRLKNDANDTKMEVMITGKSALDVEMVNGLTSGRVKMTIIGLLLVFSALLLIYRNVFKAIIPIIPVVMIIGMSSGLMYILGIKYTPITATLGALVLGMGTEMTVMLLERYLEERKGGQDKLDAMIITVTKIGKAIVASGFTTIGGFSVLMASQFVILKDFGLMTVINITLALFSTFVILPPLIMLLDKFIIGKKTV